MAEPACHGGGRAAAEADEGATHELERGGNP